MAVWTWNQPQPRVERLTPTEESVRWHTITRRVRFGLAVIACLLLTGGLARLVYYFEFLPIMGLLALVGLVMLMSSTRRGMLIIFTLTVVFEGLKADPLMLPGDLLYNGISSRLGISGVIVSPLELLLLLLLAGLLFQAMAMHQFPGLPTALKWPMVVFVGFIVLGIVRGAAGGGDLNIALWESRALFYIPAAYFLTSQILRTLDDIRLVLRLFMVGVGVYAVEGAFRYVVLINGSHYINLAPEFTFGHEVPIFLDTFLLLALSQFAFGADRWQKYTALVFSPFVLFTLLASGRRAGQIGLLIGFLVLAIVWLFVNRKAFLLITVPILLVAVVYFPVFWNNNGVLGQPARAVRSLYDPSNRDASSDEYRQLEKINVRFAILSEPVTSLGFGRPFPFIVPLPDLSWWPFWHYEPHHNILWIWMKTGIGGFIAFWALMGMSIARAANTIRAAPTREVRHFGVVCMVAVVTTLVFSYVDLGFVNPRLTLLLGVVMGALGVTRSAEALVAARENSAADVAADTATARPMTGPRRAGRLRGGARSVQPRPSEA